MTPTINTKDPRAIKLLDAAGIDYLIQTSEEDKLAIPASDFWTIPNIRYRKEVSAWDLSRKLLPARTQDEHAKHRAQAKKDEFVAYDMPLYQALFTALFEQKDQIEFAEQARSFIQKTLRQNFPNTLTRLACFSGRKGKVINNYGTNERYEIPANVVGPDRLINSGDRKLLTAILGTGDIHEINEVYNWINGTDLYIFRFNEKPQTLTEAVVGVDAYRVGAGLGCNGRPDGAVPSLGVRPHLRKAPKK